MTLQTLTKRISNGFQTAKAAEISRANASNGFVFSSRLQPCVEGAAVQALAREQTLTKSKSSNDPNNVMAGLGPSTQSRTLVRVRDMIAGAAKAERNLSLSRAPRGRWVAGSSPAMIATTTRSPACSKKADLFPAKAQSRKEDLTLLGAKRLSRIGMAPAAPEKIFAALRLCGKRYSSCARPHGLKTRTTQ